MISLDNLTVSYGGWTLFDNISLLINPKDRIGLVGKNGAGKTTLLRLIVGEQQPTSGSISYNGECTIGYLPQQMRVADTTTLVEETAKAFDEVLKLEAEIARLTREIAERTDYESSDYESLLHRLNEATDHYHILGGDTREADIEKTLLGLGFKRSDFQRATSEFSGGWRMRIELAKLLLRRPSIFLLDEPTNHLDIESIQWLEDYLKNYNGAVLLISHDRAFLDNVTTRTVEISLGKAYDYKVPYSRYVVLRAERRAQQMAAYENQQRMIEKTEEFIEKFRYKPTKSNQVQSRIKQLDRLERIEVEEEDLATLNIKFPPAPRSGQIVAEIKEAGMSFGSKHVFSGANFTIERGDKIALVGRNGEGKTTLARMIVGQLTPTEGSIRVGANVNIGYYAQNQEDLMNGDFTVYDTLDRVAVGDVRTRLRDILGAFLFRGEDIDKKVKVLSGGERARLAMARLMLEPYNLLILDEPTNHLDTDMTEWLEEYLTRNKAALLMVTHDRYFLDRVCSDILEVDQRSISLYKGNYAYYVEKKQERAEAAEARRESDLNLYRRELEWMRRQPQARATKARARIDSFHELETRLRSTRTQASLKLDVQATRIGTKIFEAKELCKRFGDLVILDRFNYNFARYDKLGIVGDNGCGKSTFLKLLTGIIQPDSGTIEVGESVRFGYYSQQGLDFDEGKRVIDIVTDIAHEIHLGDGRRMSASQFLQYFLFPPEVQYSYVARLSGGERKRLYLCTILMQSPNFLILDEPTNDLDIVTLGVLEEYLQAFKGCVIVVSHDRYFVDKVADHLLVFCGDGEIREFAGTYSDYTAWKRDYEAAKQAAVAQEKAKSTASGSRGGEIRKSRTAPAKTGAARKLTFQEKREMEHLEAEIPELEQKKAAIEEKLSSGDLPFEELTALSEQITALMDQIDTKSMRWLELNEIGG